MDNNPLVSIIVPSYKRKKEMVGRAIQSLLDQTYKNIEIVLVDDNGKDELVDYRNGLQELVLSINEKYIVKPITEINIPHSNKLNFFKYFFI